MDDDRNIKCEDCSNRDASTVKCKSVYEKQNPVTVKKNPPLAQLDRWRSIYKDSANTDDVTQVSAIKIILLIPSISYYYIVCIVGRRIILIIRGRYTAIGSLGRVH